MEAINETILRAKSAIVGEGEASHTTEPQSGVTGKGTVDSPYDQGNIEQTTAVSKNEEPPSGIAGKGTVDSPYDQGNAPEQSGPAHPQVKTIITDESNSSPGAPKQPSPDDPLASPSTTHQGSGNPLDKPTPEQEQVIAETRGRDEKSQHTTSTMLSPGDRKTTGTSANGGNFDAAKPGAGAEANKLRFERSVSPGQLADGTHVRCSGDRGESYTPGNKLSDKLKDKFHFGHKKG